MIWESHFWKDDLLKDIGTIERWQRKPWTERQSVMLEKKVMFSAYVIRKLIEARKLSDSLSTERLNVRAYPASSSVVTTIKWEKVDCHFYMNSPVIKGRSWRF